MKKWSLQGGFTLVEIVIVVALIGLLTLMVVAGSGQNIKTDSFAGQVKQFTDFLKQSQLKSTTTQTATSCGGAAQTAPGGQDGTTCFWRGTVINFTRQPGPGVAFQRDLLSGADLSQFSGFNNPATGLYYEYSDPAGVFKLGSAYVQDISVGGTAIAPGNEVALAFLAPSGDTRICNDNSVNCTPSSTNSQPFTSTSVVVFTIKDAATKLTGLVTFDPASGTISTKVQ